MWATFRTWQWPRVPGGEHPSNACLWMHATLLPISVLAGVQERCFRLATGLQRV